MNDKPGGKPPTLVLPDGTEMPLLTAQFHYEWSITVSLDGAVMPLGQAYRMLLTYREWAGQKLDRLESELGDLRAHVHQCPVAQKEAEERRKGGPP